MYLEPRVGLQRKITVLREKDGIRAYAGSLGRVPGRTKDRIGGKNGRNCSGVQGLPDLQGSTHLSLLLC